MIYFFDNYESVSVEKFVDALSPERREKYERLKQKRDKENCVVSYVILKRILEEKGVELFELDFEKDGRPFLKNCPWDFNISHCSSGVAVALSKNRVGIDIQEIRPYDPSVARRVCSPEEIEFAENSEDRDRTFIKLWTLKESAVKYDGKGLRIMRNFCFENCKNTFNKYGKKFVTFERKNLIISVCGDEDFSDIIEIKSLEDF